jgi:hypothetical protein
MIAEDEFKSPSTDYPDFTDSGRRNPPQSADQEKRKDPAVVAAQDAFGLTRSHKAAE